jgi:hypothetical protein
MPTRQRQGKKTMEQYSDRVLTNVGEKTQQNTSKPTPTVHQKYYWKVSPAIYLGPCVW